MNILELKNVVKYFGDYKATNNVSFSIKEGTVFGLLGPNGAGKSTIIRQITNIYMPDEGEITLFGEKVGPEHQNRMGYLPEERGLYKKVKVIDQLIYFAQLKGVTKSKAKEKAMQWLIKLNASDWADKKIEELSKGMQQKIQFISTILHDPEFLILDEPFSGFDPINVEILKSIVLDMKKLGKTIILSTHVMNQAEQLCDEIVLINKGEVILDGTIRDAKKRFGRDHLKLEFEGDDTWLDQIQNIEFINRTKQNAEIKLLNGEEQAQEILKTAIENVKIYKFNLVEPDLHEIFIRMVGGDKTYDELNAEHQEEQK